MMEKVLSNLISNALKFTPNGGDIFIELSESSDGKQVNLSVKDTGRGIPKNEVPRIFDRFQQVDGTTTRENEGTGIGLSLVKQLVELHGGTIRVESAEGSGSEFTVSLPKKPIDTQRPHDADDAYQLVSDIEAAQAVLNGANACTTPAAASNFFEKESATILIVEDNKDMRMLISEGFAPYCRVVEAQNGEEGVAQAKETMPDLIISDIMMPKMDGYQLCEFLQKDDVLRHIPIIFLTAKASEEMAVKSLKAGAYDYIAKPFNFNILKAKVDGILGRKEAYARLSRMDHLTQLRNREGWELEVQKELDKMMRYGGSASIAFIDLDDFKAINDSFGHAAGDRLLKVVSSLIQKGIRKTDIAGRYGGEEFIIFFLETSKDAAAQCLERILSKLRCYRFKEDALQCSFSAGVIGVDQDGMTPLEKYVSKADAAMYAAKNQGKNCIVVQQDTP
jgi:diguanylate cyclase (GGDEF)-like protein